MKIFVVAFNILTDIMCVKTHAHSWRPCICLHSQGIVLRSLNNDFRQQSQNADALSASTVQVYLLPFRNLSYLFHPTMSFVLDPKSSWSLLHSVYNKEGKIEKILVDSRRLSEWAKPEPDDPIWTACVLNLYKKDSMT